MSIIMITPPNGRARLNSDDNRETFGKENPENMATIKEEYDDDSECSKAAAKEARKENVARNLQGRGSHKEGRERVL